MGNTAKKYKVYIGLGSNMGDRHVNLAKAVKSLQEADFTLVAQSPIYVSPAWGKTDQAAFLNMAIEVKTAWEPQAALQKVLDIEAKMGRQRMEKWGPRLIDIDILDWEGEEIETEQLQVPHPFMAQRAFVLIPLAGIAPDYVHPATGLGIFEMLDELSDADKAGIMADPAKNP